MSRKQRMRCIAGAIATLAAGTAAALPVVDPRPMECTDARWKKLSHVLPGLLEDDAISPAADVFSGCFQPCASRGALIARAISPAALDALQADYRDIKSAQFGDELVMDLTSLSGRPEIALEALCSIADGLTDIRFLGGATTSRSAAVLEKGIVNNEWRTAIKLPAAAPRPSRLTVAIIDGGIRGDHLALPQVEDYEVSDYVRADGTCRSGRCCTAIELGNPTVHGGVYEDHPAMTLGTIAAAPGHEPGVSGLALPGRILSIDPRGHGCGSAWDWATAIACAVELGADVIHFSVEGIPGHAERLLFEAGMARATDSVLVVPAGNRRIHLDACPRWPTSLNGNVLTVTAFDRTGGSASSVGYGAGTVDLGFPMYSLYTTAGQGPNSYNTLNRTSATSAIVTGSLLLMSGHANFDQCSATELSDLLLKFATPPRDSFWRRNMSKAGGQLDIGFLNSEIRDANGVALDYCP